MFEEAIDIFTSAFHFLIAVILLFYLLPRLIFARMYADNMEQTCANLLKTTFLILVTGYVLIALRLFELMSVVFLLILIARLIRRYRKRTDSFVEGLPFLQAMVYDYFDGKYKLQQVAGQAIRMGIKRSQAWIYERFSPGERLTVTVGMAAVFLIVIAINFSEVFDVTALPFFDSYKNLEWIKDMRLNTLYADGIVSQGFHVLWSAVQELSRLDAWYIVNYSGLFIRLLMLVGIYFSVSRLTNNRLAGLIGIAAYVLWGTAVDPYFWEWETISSPVTLAQSLALPALYYLIIHLREGNRDAEWTWYAGLSVAAFVHVGVSYVLLIALVAITIWSQVNKSKTERVTLMKLYACSAAAWGLSCIPLIIGWVSGRTFILADTYVMLPEPSVSPLLLGAVTGLVWNWLFGRLRAVRLRRGLEIFTSIAVLTAGMAGMWVYTAEPVKADWDSAFQQYRNIAEDIEPRDWMIVSKQSLSSVVQGTGYHMNIDMFTDRYDPTFSQLTRLDDGLQDMDVPKHVFLLMEKSFRTVQLADIQTRLKELHERWHRQYERLAEWINRYQAEHGSIPIFYEDEHIIVYYLERVEEELEETTRTAEPSSKGEIL